MLVCIVSFFMFFFKQKTAYEMRISDWSSDVCSSDLTASIRPPLLVVSSAGRRVFPLNPLGRDVRSSQHFLPVLGDRISLAFRARRFHSDLFYELLRLHPLFCALAGEGVRKRT